MARVMWSALLSGGSGAIGDVVLSRWKGIPYVRRRVIPANPRSGDQCKQRHVLSTALLLWQSIKAAAKAPWDHSVSGEPISGYNQFMDNCIGTLIPQFTAGITGADPTWETPAVTVGFPYNPDYAELIGVDGGTPAAESMAITWTKRAGCNGANHVRAYYRLDNETAWSQFEAEDEATQTITITGLTDDLQYEFMLVGIDIATAAWSQSSHMLNTPTTP